MSPGNTGGVQGKDANWNDPPGRLTPLLTLLQEWAQLPTAPSPGLESAPTPGLLEQVS